MLWQACFAHSASARLFRWRCLGGADALSMMVGSQTRGRVGMPTHGLAVWSVQARIDYLEIGLSLGGRDPEGRAEYERLTGKPVPRRTFTVEER